MSVTHTSIEKTYADTLPSIYIPTVSTNVSKQQIKNHIEIMGLGGVKLVDLITKTKPNGEKFNMAFVHFEQWNDGYAAQQTRIKLLTGQRVNVMYDQQKYLSFLMYDPQHNNKSNATQRQITRLKRQISALKKLLNDQEYYLRNHRNEYEVDDEFIDDIYESTDHPSFGCIYRT